MRNISSFRLQISMTQEFAVTEYKVQEAIFKTAIFDSYRYTK